MGIRCTVKINPPAGRHEYVVQRLVFPDRIDSFLDLMRFGDPQGFTNISLKKLVDHVPPQTELLFSSLFIFLAKNTHVSTLPFSVFFNFSIHCIFRKMVIIPDFFLFG